MSPFLCGYFRCWSGGNGTGLRVCWCCGCSCGHGKATYGKYAHSCHACYATASTCTTSSRSEFSWSPHDCCMYKVIHVSRVIGAAGRTLDMLCQQQPTLRLVQLTQKPVQLHQLCHRPCRRPSSKVACTQLSTSTRAEPVCLHLRASLPLSVYTEDVLSCERDLPVSTVWSITLPLKRRHTQLVLPVWHCT